MAVRIRLNVLRVYFIPKNLCPFYDSNTVKEANNYICVLATVRDPCIVFSLFIGMVINTYFGGRSA